jgi:hypothetical protein
MQHGTPQRVSENTARQLSRRSLCIRLQPLSHVARHVFQTISQYLVTTATLLFSIRNVPTARMLVPVHTGGRSRIHPGSRVSRRGRIVS